jgi:hypothetical protein
MSMSTANPITVVTALFAASRQGLLRVRHALIPSPLTKVCPNTVENVDIKAIRRPQVLLDNAFMEERVIGNYHKR